MSARLNMEQIRYFPWKGQTFTQITSSLKKNDNNSSSDNVTNIFRAMPVKLYRREIASQTITSGNARTSSSIDLLNMPNGYSIVNSNENCNALDNNIDMNIPNSTYETGKCVPMATQNTSFSQAANARRRLRSSGSMKKYNIDDRKQNYYTSRAQYMYDRNQTFEQNQKQYITTDTNCDQPTPKSKASNSRFYQQGGVSASDLIARKKYDEITSSAAKYQSAYGSSVANALAYNAHDTSYTAKDKAGYPMKSTPVFSKYSDGFKKCELTKITYAS
jgi:hypothetical protein